MDLPKTSSLVSSSVSRQLFLSLMLVALGSAGLGILLTLIAHRIVLEPFIAPDDLSLVSELMIFVLAFVTLAAAGISALAAYLLARRFTLPISQLVGGMHRVLHNDLNVKINLERQDELGSLIKFFNAMVQKLQEIRSRNEAISELKSQFVSVAAHQLRTPLTGLNWSLHWLLQERGGPLSPPQKQAVTQQLTATTQMISMVNELLDVALAEEGKFGYAPESIDIALLMDDVLKSFAPAAEVRDITIALQNQAPPHVKITADPVQLKLALSNLVDNAIRYTKPKGTVTLTLSQQQSWLHIIIKDTGIGIPKGEQGKLFTKFFRATNAKRIQPDGSGLGLFMVHNVIKNHGGSIAVDSAPNHGTTFNIKLPLHSTLSRPASPPLPSSLS